MVNLKKKYRVLPITRADYKEWLLYKHYAHRMPSIILHAFGLYNDQNIIDGVCIFGLAGNRNINSIEDYSVIELTRLVINDNLEKNCLSYFVSQCLKKIPVPQIIISYADENNGHHGYIYQATNWLYTGTGAETKVGLKNGKEYHMKSIWDTIGSNKNADMERAGYEIITHLGKHRYFYILSENKKQKEKMLDAIKKHYKIQPYPKGDNKRYDASYEPDLQPVLF